jgi:hypothetical protein
MSAQNNTPPPPDVELKFQMHAMMKMKMRERMNLMMGNVCDRLEKVGIRNMAGTCTQDVRKVGAQHKSTMAVGLKGQGGLIIRILRRTLMILVMAVLRMRS